MALIQETAKVYINKARTHTIVKSPYSTQLVSAIRAIPGAKWWSEQKFWSLPVDQLGTAKDAVRPFYQIDGEENQVAWKTVKMRVRFEQHKTRTVRKYGKAVMIDSTDLINVDYGNLYTVSSDFDILESTGGFVDGDEHSAYWTVEYLLTIKMRENARIEAIAGTYEMI